MSYIIHTYLLTLYFEKETFLTTEIQTTMVKHPILRQGDNNTAFYLQLMNSLTFYILDVNA